MTGTRVRWGVVVLAFLAVFLDGFDSASLSFVLPTLAKEWDTVPAAFTPAVVTTNVGVVLGYLASGALAARFGLRRLLVTGAVSFGVGSLATGLVLATESVTVLSVVRLLTGVGLGVVLPSAVSAATAHNPASRQQLVSVAVTLGLASGATVAGAFGGRMLDWAGATGVFWIGGALPLLLSAAMLWRLPAPAARSALEDAEGARVKNLFTPGLRATTTLLWAFAFLVFIASYTLQSWVPTLLTGYGFSASRAPVGLAFLSFGGVAGGILLLVLAARIGIAAALVVMPVIGALSMLAAATLGLNGTGLLLALGGAGAGVTAGQIGQLTLAGSLYAPGTRTTGVGWAAALGRLGSIVGPGAAGILLALALPATRIVLLTTIPVLVAAVCAAALWRLPRRPAPAARIGPAGEAAR